MAKNEINTAFDILLDEVEGMVNDLNEDGARALRSRDYDRATGLIEQATRLTDFRERVRGLQREWQSVYAPRAPRGRKKQRKARARLARGVRTPDTLRLAVVRSAAPLHRQASSPAAVLQGVPTWLTLLDQRLLHRARQVDEAIATRVAKTVWEARHDHRL